MTEPTPGLYDPGHIMSEDVWAIVVARRDPRDPQTVKDEHGRHEQ